MITILLIISSSLTIFFYYLYFKETDENNDNDNNNDKKDKMKYKFLKDLYFRFACLLLSTTFILFFILIPNIYNLFDCISAKREIIYYEEENTQIEKSVIDTVKNYINYDKELTYEEALIIIKENDDLKSNTSLCEKIDTYSDNKGSIKSKKIDLIKGSVAKWNLYFGN